MDKRDLEVDISNMILSGAKPEWSVNTLQKVLRVNKNKLIKTLDNMVKGRVLNLRTMGKKHLYTLNDPTYETFLPLHVSFGFHLKWAKPNIKAIKNIKPLFITKGNHPKINPKAKDHLEVIDHYIERLFIVNTRLMYARTLELTEPKYLKLIEKLQQRCLKTIKQIFDELIKDHKESEYSIKKYFALKTRVNTFRVFADPEAS